jgi:DNA-binding response OmpR family regulator
MGTLLIIEDDFELSRMMRLFLEKHGHQVYTAANGIEALYQINAYRPDLIILDLMMPLAPGEAVLEHIRQTPDLRDIPVLVVSALPTAQAQVADLNVAEVLQKPIEMRFLAERVNSLLTPAG